MAYSFAPAEGRPLEFSTRELTGALGDSVTVLPIVVAATALSDLSIATVLLGFALWQVVWGLHYRVPVSVEPMKALAALVIAGSLTAGGIAVAGLLAGGALLVAGTTGSLARLEALVGEPVVRGVQLAVALVLLQTGLALGLDAPSLAATAAVLVAAVALLGYRRLGALAVLGLGGALAAAHVGLPTPAIPRPGLVGLPLSLALDPGVLGATAGQLAMTVGNAAVATSLLLSEYYHADVSADELATSMGAMNLAAVPFGALPMCHGSGGVAGKYAFGARSAGANLILGALYAGTALFAVELVAAFPMAVLGVVMAVVGIELGRTALDSDGRGLTVAVGIGGLVAGIGVAFLAGLAVWQLGARWRRPGAPA
jgi:hypothetical protein